MPSLHTTINLRINGHSAITNLFLSAISEANSMSLLCFFLNNQHMATKDNENLFTTRVTHTYIPLDADVRKVLAQDTLGSSLFEGGKC